MTGTSKKKCCCLGEFRCDLCPTVGPMQITIEWSIPSLCPVLHTTVHVIRPHINNALQYHCFPPENPPGPPQFIGCYWDNREELGGSAGGCCVPDDCDLPYVAFEIQLGLPFGGGRLTVSLSREPLVFAHGALRALALGVPIDSSIHPLCPLIPGPFSPPSQSTFVRECFTGVSGFNFGQGQLNLIGLVLL